MEEEEEEEEEEEVSSVATCGNKGWIIEKVRVVRRRPTTPDTCSENTIDIGRGYCCRSYVFTFSLRAALFIDARVSTSACTAVIESLTEEHSHFT